MNEDRVKGKAKDVAGRVERQVGEWTGDSEAQAEGTLKQAEGKVQNAFGKAKDALKKPAKGSKTEEEIDESAAADEERRRSS